MQLSLIHRKESTIMTAIEILDDLGIQGLSTREIARREKISEGTLFKHFKNKNDIIIAILDKFSQFDTDIMQTIRFRNEGFKDSITFFIKSYAEYYENYPAITSLVNAYEVFRWEIEIERRYKEILENRRNFIKQLIEEGQAKEEVRQGILSEHFSEIIIGTNNQIVLEWRISRYSFSLKSRMLQAIDTIIKAFLIQDISEGV